MEIRILLVIFFIASFIHESDSTTFTLTNHCPYNIWTANLTFTGPLSSTDSIAQPSQNSRVISAPPHWSGRIWARAPCSQLVRAYGGQDPKTFSCKTRDCEINWESCFGKGGVPGIGRGQNYEFGFNIPIKVIPSSGCPTKSCIEDVNVDCANEIAITNVGAKIGCKSECLIFFKPESCCNGPFSTPNSCKPSSDYSQDCLQTHSYYNYGEKRNTPTCPKGDNYQVIFCPF